MKTCCLCASLACDAAPQPWDNPLFESQNFAALPSLGSLVEGWLLLVPKEHFICMGALPNELLTEMEDMKAKISAYVTNEYGTICVFEHGPAVASRQVGCSVDHAHLHIVPLAFDIGEAARPFMPCDSEWRRASWGDCREANQVGRDYLYFEQPLGHGRISTHTDFGSQVFRKAIASKIDRSTDFDWRKHPELEAVGRTINVLSHAAHSLERIRRGQ